MNIKQRARFARMNKKARVDPATPSSRDFLPSFDADDQSMLSRVTSGPTGYASVSRGNAFATAVWIAAQNPSYEPSQIMDELQTSYGDVLHHKDLYQISNLAYVIAHPKETLDELAAGEPPISISRSRLAPTFPEAKPEFDVPLAGAPGGAGSRLTEPEIKVTRQRADLSGIGTPRVSEPPREPTVSKLDWRRTTVGEPISESAEGRPGAAREQPGAAREQPGAGEASVQDPSWWQRAWAGAKPRLPEAIGALAGLAAGIALLHVLSKEKRRSIIYNLLTGSAGAVAGALLAWGVTPDRLRPSVA